MPSRKWFHCLIKSHMARNITFGENMQFLSIHGAVVCQLFPFCDWCEQPLKRKFICHFTSQVHSSLIYMKNQIVSNNLQI